MRDRYREDWIANGPVVSLELFENEMIQPLDALNSDFSVVEEEEE